MFRNLVIAGILFWIYLQFRKSKPVAQTQITKDDNVQYSLNILETHKNLDISSFDKGKRHLERFFNQSQLWKALV